ncbi:MAG: bifunctional phosphopantothenoylcysteine decarboxylase/phosphopantothenate--cysteine ligase CoaBC, partial [Bacteroidota bacterium]
MVRGKHILLGVSGSIAAYKAAVLTRLLVKEGARVKVVMTPAAREFITPLTLSTLSKHPVISTYTDDPDSGAWNNHVELGLWADAMVIAPASANTLAKMAQGICDNVLMATYLSAKCPVFVAPAMDLDMYRHPASVANREQLAAFGHTVIAAGHGELASGLVGEGRMAEPEEILEVLQCAFGKESPLAGKKVLVSAGPTHEPIDPVRFIGNRSSGKMGFALAHAAAELGATVTLVTGPTALAIDHPQVERIDVETAAQMLEACRNAAADAQVVIMSAAVADYTPAEVADQKVKKQGNQWAIALEPTTDILAELGQQKPAGQVLVGFALETENELEHAKGKLARKNLDLIALNSLNDSGAGFGHDTNKVT